jgi:putative transcriptional regulator
MATRDRDPDPTAEELLAPPVEPDPALRRRILASLDPTTRFEGFVARVAGLFDLPEARAREVLAAGDAVQEQSWVDAFVPGVRLFHLQGGERVAGADCGLVHLAPGVRFPAHRHLGREWTLSLAGSAREDGGEVWLPGDLVVREPGSAHSFLALGDEPYLFAAVLFEGLEPVGSDAD